MKLQDVPAHDVSLWNALYATINDLPWSRWQLVLWFACCNLDTAHCPKTTQLDCKNLDTSTASSIQDLWPYGLQADGCCLFRYWALPPDRSTPCGSTSDLSAECPELACQSRHTITSGQHVSFEARQNTESTQPDSSTTVQSPSGTQDGLCLHISNTSFRMRKNSSPKKTFNWWRLMAMRTSLRYSSLNVF